ncbi:unnamed protein product [Rhizophagus irregularis]|nr:unnamed protein product [Rhizophagus irregularis]
MSQNNQIDNWDKWVEDAISKKYIKHYEYKHFINIQEIGTGSFGKVYRANWKNLEQCLALKSFLKLDNITAKELIHELDLQREVNFHNNIISFYGITISDQENTNDQTMKYLLVMEYADSGSLQNYLKNNFSKLTWNDKYNLAYQLACATLCLHNEGIIHRDLHSGNVLVHQNTIKISSGKSPFENEQYNCDLAARIAQGLRETIVPSTPCNYAELYIECWNNEPDNRPAINDDL